MKVCMSGGLLGVGWLIFREKIRTQELEEHEASARDAAGSPLRNGTHRHLANPGDFEASAEIIDEFVLVHATKYRTLNRNQSSKLYLFLFRILNNDHNH